MECTAINPLNLPEIVASFGPFLSSGSLAKCLRVSKLWYRMLVPCLYKETKCDFQGSLKCPRQSSIQKYACFIQSLSIDYYSALTLFNSAATFPILASLVIKQTAWGKPFDDPTLVNIILRHRETLKSVSINQHANDALLTVLEDCTRLESLSLRNQEHVQDTAGCIYQFNHLWSRLHSISLEDDRDTKPQQPASTKAMYWPQPNGPNRIENLSLIFHHPETIPGFCSWIVKQCPDLVRVRWFYGADDPKSPMKQLADILQHDPSFGKRLEDISLRNMNFSNEYFSILVGSLVHLRRLDLYSTNFSPESWTILRTTRPSHLQTLAVLDLDQCRRLSGEAIHQMLCEMPNLKTFLATKVEDKVIMEDSRPWVCLGMEELSLGLSLTHFSADASVRSLVLQRYLALVGQLKDLDTLAKFLPRDEYGSILFIELEHGLDALKGLRRLRIAKWSDRYTHEDEIRWILENWIHLESPSRTGLQNALVRGRFVKKCRYKPLSE